MVMSEIDQATTIWWVDDDHADETGPREGERRALVRQAGNGLDLVPIHPAEFEERASNLGNQPSPDLLLFDFRLGMQEHPERHTPLFARNGVTLRGMSLGIEALKDTPAYLVSGVTKEAQTGSVDVNFDWVLSHRQLINEFGGTFLLGDATDYRNLRYALTAASGHSDGQATQLALVDPVLELLKVPAPSIESVTELLDHAIGTLLRSESMLDSDDMKLAPSRPRTLARWVRSALHRLRGPLIDDLTAATMMGAKVDYFRSTLLSQVDPHFIRYKGIFQTTASMKLWRRALLETLLSKCHEIELSPPSALAQTAAQYFGVPEPQRAVCRVCKSPWPEAVAYDEDDPSEKAAVHWRCSREATDVDNVFGFDIARSFSS